MAEMVNQPEAWKVAIHRQYSAYFVNTNNLDCITCIQLWRGTYYGSQNGGFLDPLVSNGQHSASPPSGWRNMWTAPNYLFLTMCPKNDAILLGYNQQSMFCLFRMVDLGFTGPLLQVADIIRLWQASYLKYKGLLLRCFLLYNSICFEILTISYCSGRCCSNSTDCCAQYSGQTEISPTGSRTLIDSRVFKQIFLDCNLGSLFLWNDFSLICFSERLSMRHRRAYLASSPGFLMGYLHLYSTNSTMNSDVALRNHPHCPFTDWWDISFY